MLERDATHNDLIDRIERIEMRIEDLRDVSRPSEVIVVEQGEWQSLAGWVSTGTVLRSLGGEIVLDPTVPRIRIAPDGYIESADFVTGVSGFQIDGGTAEFNDVVVRGTIYATAGELGDLAVTGSVTVGAAAPYIVIDGANKRIRSSNYAAGYAGFTIEQSGDAEFNHVRVRGALSATTFVKDLIEARAGSLMVVKSGGPLAADMVVPAVGWWYAFIDDPPGGGFLFANSDVCRCKSEYSGGIGDIWFIVTDRTDMGDGTQRYACTYQSGTRSITYPAGAPVLDYGVSGDGGLWLTADDGEAPFLSVFTHAGSPWTTITEHLRLGNLSGTGGYVADAYGVFIGDYAGDKWLSYDPTNSLRIRGDAVVDGTITVGKLDIVAGGYNILSNSGFNDDDDGDNVPDRWTLGGNAANYTITMHSTVKVLGNYSVRLWSNAAGNTAGQYRDIRQTVTLADVPLAVGDKFALSGYLRTDSMSNLRAEIYVTWLDAGSGAISSHYAAQVTGNQAWTRHTVTGTVPANAVTGRIYCMITVTVNDGTGAAYFDAIQLERGDVATAWTPGMLGNVVIDSNRVQVRDSTGAKVWMGMRGTDLGVWGEDDAGDLQFYLKADDGQAYAGGGVVRLNDGGIEIEVATTWGDTRSYKFVESNGDVVARVGAYHDEAVNNYRSVGLRTFPHANMSSVVWIISESPEGNECQANMWATHDDGAFDHEAFLSCSTDEINDSFIWWTIDGNQMGKIEDGHTYLALRGDTYSSQAVHLQADNELTYNTSVRAAKTNIKPLQTSRQMFMALQPTTYNDAQRPRDKDTVGLIAEDVEAVFPEAATYMQKLPPGRQRLNKNMDTPAELVLSGWAVEPMLVATISVVQQQERDIEALTERVALLEGR